MEPTEGKNLEPKAEKGIVKYCPVCGAEYEGMETNTKQTCPIDAGGCGKTFLIRVF